MDIATMSSTSEKPEGSAAARGDRIGILDAVFIWQELRRLNIG
jgi:hypothetical protein